MTVLAEWRCVGVPPRVPPCGAGGVGDPSPMDREARRHTELEGHGTYCHANPTLRRAPAPETPSAAASGHTGEAGAR